MGTTDAELVVDGFMAAWERRDVDELLSYFTDDAVWQPGPMKPAVGRAELREAMSDWLHGAAGIRPEIHRTVSVGSAVMHERTDHYTLRGRVMATPVAAAFDIENGRIAAWREYFDMAPFAGG